MKRVLQAIEELLRTRVGLDANTGSRRMLQQVLQERMAARGMTDGAAYLACLESDPDETANLINAVVVPETWFFRDGEPFEYLKNYVTRDWLPWHPGQRLRVLSLPCATGEEPFSIAMALMDICLEPGFFLVDAVDVSRVSLDKARAGVFGRHSFRGEAAVAAQARYFAQEGNLFRIIDDIRSSVRFVEAHALEFASSAPTGAYDIVFCRNLLIYLTDDVRRKLLRELDRLLVRDGLFFLGHAEAPCVFLPQYEPVKHPGAFATHKKRPVRTEFLSPPEPAPRPPAPPMEAPVSRPSRGDLPLVDSKPPEGNELDRARQCADRGEYDRAMALCGEALAKTPGRAEAYRVCGLVALARGREEEAVGHFEKALYLEPTCREAMIHLALLMDKAGRSEQAKRYHRMAERSNSASIEAGV